MSRTALAAALLAACSALPAHAAWPTSPYTGNLPVTALGGSKTDARVVSDGAGGTIVVFAVSTGGDVYAQRFDRDGNKLWPANGYVVVNSAGTQGAPVAVADGVGGVIVAWVDSRNSGSTGLDLYAQRLSGAGAQLWAGGGVVVCTAPLDQTQPVICSDGAGGAVIGWSDGRTPANFADLYAQRVTAAGAVAWAANGVAVSATTLDQFELRLCPDGAGGAIFSWSDFRSGTSFDIYANRISAAGSVLWLTNGRAVCTQSGDQRYGTPCPDGVGGALVFWADRRSATDYDIYGQKLAAQTGFALWTSNGVAVCAQADDQYKPVATSDAAGGAIVVWEDERNSAGISDLYAQRVAPGGSPVWASAGVALSTAVGDQRDAVAASDGLGGALVCWLDERFAPVLELYAARLTPTGGNAWTSGGLLVSNGPLSRYGPSVEGDGDGGAYIGWTDTRDPAGSQVLVQRVERYGFLGDPAPVITSVKDVPNDEGGAVKLSWDRSHLDAEPLFGIVEYRLFRSVPPGAWAAMGATRAVTDDSDVAARDGALLVGPAGTLATAWEYVATQVSEGLASYSRVLATTADSVGGSNPTTYFMVEARAGTAISSDRWFSRPDSGYSVDNLAPAVPLAFAGFYAGGATRLAWRPVTAADLAGYRLYRGSTLDFKPGPANLVAALPDTGYLDPAGAPFVYKLTAVDVHGNESPAATLLPDGTVDAPVATARALSLSAPWPNPARGRATMRFTLPMAGPVQVAVFDAAGREVRRLRSGRHAAGEHALEFELTDDGGNALAPGLYLVRLQTPAGRLTRRLAAVR
jgi:hypothetical protein